LSLSSATICSLLLLLTFTTSYTLFILSFFFFFLLLPRPPRSTLFPYTTLFRSLALGHSLARSGIAAIFRQADLLPDVFVGAQVRDRKSTRLNSSHDQISYAVFCLKKKKKKKKKHQNTEQLQHDIPLTSTSGPTS